MCQRFFLSFIEILSHSYPGFVLAITFLTEGNYSRVGKEQHRHLRDHSYVYLHPDEVPLYSSTNPVWSVTRLKYQLRLGYEKDVKPALQNPSYKHLSFHFVTSETLSLDWLLLLLSTPTVKHHEADSRDSLMADSHVCNSLRPLQFSPSHHLTDLQVSDGVIIPHAVYVCFGLRAQ